MFQDKKEIEKILSALGDQLDAINVSVPDLVVCGGSALNVLGLVSRTTQDVDVVALNITDPHGRTYLEKADPLPSGLVAAAGKVARDFNLPDSC